MRLRLTEGVALGLFRRYSTPIHSRYLQKETSVPTISSRLSSVEANGRPTSGNNASIPQSLWPLMEKRSKIYMLKSIYTQAGIRI